MWSEARIAHRCALVLLPLLAGWITGCPQDETQSQSTSSATTTAQPAATAQPQPEPEPEWRDLAADSGQWWSEGCDPYNQGLTTNHGPHNPELKWTCELGLNPTGQLVLAPDGSLVVGLTAAAAWRGFIAPEYIIGRFTDTEEVDIHAGGVAVVSAAGELRWTRQTHAEPWLVVTRRPDARVIVQCSWREEDEILERGNVPDTMNTPYGELVCWDLDGTELWRNDTDGMLLGEMVYTDKSIYGFVAKFAHLEENGFYDGSKLEISLLNVALDGTVNWRYRLPHMDEAWGLTPSCQPVLLRNDKLGVCWNDRAYRTFNLDGGKGFTYTFRSVPDCRIAVASNSDLVLLANDRPMLTDKQLDMMSWEAMNNYGVMHVLHESGSLNWNIQIGSDCHSAPAVDNTGRIHFGTNFYIDRRDEYREIGRVYAVRMDKHIDWEYDCHAGFADSDVQPDPLIDGGRTLYISDKERHLYALNLDGTLRWEYAAPQGFATNPVIGADGTLYIGGRDGLLYALGDPE